jgi:hypothetical protein
MSGAVAQTHTTTNTRLEDQQEESPLFWHLAAVASALDQMWQALSEFLHISLGATRYDAPPDVGLRWAWTRACRDRKLSLVFSVPWREP